MDDTEQLSQGAKGVLDCSEKKQQKGDTQAEFLSLDLRSFADGMKVIAAICHDDLASGSVPTVVYRRNVQGALVEIGSVAYYGASLPFVGDGLHFNRDTNEVIVSDSKSGYAISTCDPVDVIGVSDLSDRRVQEHLMTVTFLASLAFETLLTA